MRSRRVRRSLLGLALVTVLILLGAPIIASYVVEYQWWREMNQVPTWLGVPLSTAAISHLEFMIFGALIIFFLIVEPHGLARLWAIGKEKLRLWPFPH